MLPSISKITLGCIKEKLKDVKQDSFEGILILLCAIVLQTFGPTVCINSPAFHVDSPTKPILVVFCPTNHWSCSTVGLLIWWSREVCCWS